MFGDDFAVLAEEPVLREPALAARYRRHLPAGTERLSHYFEARPAEQFDVLVHIDETRALDPLDRTSEWEAGEEVPETYTTAL